MRNPSASSFRFLLIPLVFSASLAHAVDPYQQNGDRQRALDDPEKYSRPVTNELKGAEIKEYRDKLNAVKAQVFREGAPPTGSSLRAVVKDAAQPSSNLYVAQGRFSDFSTSVRQQIEAKLGGTPAPDARVEAQVNVGKDAVAVANARVVPTAGSVTGAIPGTDLTPTTRRPGVDVPRQQPAGLAVRPLRDAAPAKATRDAAVARQTNAPKNAAPAPRADNAAVPASPEAAVVKPVPFPGLGAAAKALLGTPAPTSPILAVDGEPVAIIPLADGPPMVVTSRGNQGTSQIVSIVAPASRLPEALKAQVRADKGATAMPADATPVQLTVEVRADRTIRVTDVKAAPSATVAVADAKPASPVPVPPGAPVAAPVTPNNSNPVAPVVAPSIQSPAAPGSAATTTSEPFPAVAAAKALATSIGLDPSTVRLQRPPDKSEATTLTVVTEDDRSVQLDAVKPDAENKPTMVRAEGRFGDLAPATKQQVREILGRFNASPMVTDFSPVVVEARPVAQNQFQIVSISVKDPQTPGREAVLIWNEGQAIPGQAPRPGTEAAQPEPGTPAGTAPTQTAKPTDRPAPPRPGGLAPSVAAIALKALGLPDATYSIRPGDPKGGIKIDPVMPGKPDVVVAPQRRAREGMNDFAVLGKNVDFTDSIRAQVDAMLRAAVENGETWATDALKGNRQILVTFEVNDAAQESAVRVKEVAPTPQWRWAFGREISSS